jgi:hypothetical protein
VTSTNRENADKPTVVLEAITSIGQPTDLALVDSGRPFEVTSNT